MKTFTLGEVLTVITKKLLAPQGAAGMYTVVRYMVGVPVLTHELPDAFAHCAPAILAKYPQLANIDASGVNSDNYAPWMLEQIRLYGDSFPLAKLPWETWNQPPFPKNTTVVFMP